MEQIIATVNITVNGIAIFVYFALLLTYDKFLKIQDKKISVFYEIVACALFETVFDLANNIYVFASDPALLSRGSFKALSQILGYVYCLLFTKYALTSIGKGTKNAVYVIQVVITAVISITILVLANTEAIYYYDANGNGVRGKFYVLTLALAGVEYLMTAVCVFTSKAESEKKIEVIEYGIVPFIAVVTSFFIKDYAVVPFVIFANVIVLFSNLYTSMKIDSAKLESELSQTRIDILISQINPHFLYNTLSSIVGLCVIDPQKAQDVTKSFADYLRGNIKALNDKNPIPFGTEINHVQTYVNIEKVRFGSRVNVVYDLKCTDFQIPALTVQPLIENSIKHGILNKENGGTVVVTSEEKEDGYYVSVVDDGIGFDKKEVEKDGKMHVGINCVTERLAHMSNGTLTIESEIGKGTKSVVFIPKAIAEEDTKKRKRLRKTK